MIFFPQSHDTDVLYLKISFSQESDSFGVPSVFADCHSFVLGIDGNDCDGFSVRALSYPDFLHSGGF